MNLQFEHKESDDFFTLQNGMEVWENLQAELSSQSDLGNVQTVSNLELSVRPLCPFFSLTDSLIPVFSSDKDGTEYYARFGQGEYEVLNKNDDLPPVNYIRLEAIAREWMDNYPIELLTNSDRSSDAFIRFYAEAPIAQIELKFTKEQTDRFDELIQLLLADERNEEPQQWFIIRLGPKGNESSADVILLSFYSTLFTEGEDLSLAGIEIVDELTRARLETIVDTSYIPSATQDEITGLINPLSNNEIGWSIVYDVGQGNSIGLCSKEGSVLAYFDLGGGCGPNVRTFPPALQHFCFILKPLIILSHWDEDHWSSAHRDPRALAMNWIAPRQKIGTNQAAMIASIQNAGGKIWFLPEGFTTIRTSQFSIELATGSGRNNSGIVLTLIKERNGVDMKILMPGDANYNHIASFTGGAPYISVVASHHGGAMKDIIPPYCQMTKFLLPRLVYSAGSKNTYNHPLPETRASHSKVGWKVFLTRETSSLAPSELGHVYLGWPNHVMTPFPIECTCKCSLRPSQT